MAEDNSENRIKNLRESLELNKKELDAMSLSLNTRKKQYLIEEKRGLLQKILVESEKESLSLTGSELIKKRDILKTQREELRNLDKKLKTERNISDVLGKIWNKTKSTRDYLMQSDKAIKSISLEFGITAAKSQIVRSSIEGAASFSAQLGISTGELAVAAKIYADETGRAALLSAESYKSIALIGAGTGLGIENAAKLAGQFELMGLNAENSASNIEQILNTTDRMGVNATKVFKNISANFNRLQTMTFRNGVKDFAKMAAYSEKFKIDMGSMIDSAGRARTLEGAVDLAAQLQVMGGEFAKSDPFELLFLSRNDPAKFTQKINEMTKGVATFKKNADGTFETFVSAVDIDRLERVGQALGMDTGQLVNQAKQMTLIQKMRSEMINSGFSREQKEAVEGMARLNNKTGKFSIAGVTKDIGTLTKSQLDAVVSQSKSLEERAKAAQNFEDAFQNTIQSLKATLLPVLTGVNKVLEKMRPVVERGVKWVDDLNTSWKMAGAVAVALIGAGGLLKGAFKLGSMALGGSGGAGMLKGGGGMLKGGAGIGLATAGTGAGIMMAGKGISMISDSLKGLDDKQLKALKEIRLGLGNLMVILPIVGAAATAGAVGMLALGGTVTMIGAGIGIAASGIGKMAEGLSKLDNVNINGIGVGMAGIGAASLMMGNPMGIIGAITLNKSISGMAKHADGIQKLGAGLEPLNTLLKSDTSNLTEIRGLLQDISRLQTNSSSFSSLAGILSKPLKVEFSNKEVAMNLQVDMYLDSDKVSEGLNLARRLEIQQSDQKNQISAAS